MPDWSTREKLTNLAAEARSILGGGTDYEGRVHKLLCEIAEIDTIALVISRQQWARGGINGASRMLNQLGNMCCLGFLGVACGYTPRQLLDRADPEEVVRATATNGDEYRDMFPDGTFDTNSIMSDTVDSLIAANDATLISEEEREGQVTKLMAELGVKVTFVD